MAEKKTVIDPSRTYRVVLTKSVQVGRSTVHPGPNVKLRGDILSSVIAASEAAVESYTPVG